jgi:dynactin-5
VRADLNKVLIGRYSRVGRGTVLRPAVKDFQGRALFFPLEIGDHVTIGADCVVSAATVGACVRIGAGAVVAARCVLKDCSVVAPGAVLAPDTVVPPFAVFAGCPARMVAELPPTFQALQRESSIEDYRMFRAAK